MTDRDHIAVLLTGLPRPAPPAREVTEAAATFGWFPDPPWFAPVPVQPKPQ